MTRDSVRTVIGCFIIGSFTGALVALYCAPIPTDNKDLLTFMLGQLSGFAAAIMSFHFGTSKGSADKTDALASLAGKE